MTSTFLITSAAVCFSLGAVAAAGENYSLWPRRPAELEQARRMVREGKFQEAVDLLAPFVSDTGIAGREARHMTSAVNVRRYLSRRHPKVRVVVVKRGDNLASLAAANHCPVDMIMLLNGCVQPSSLRVGQKLVVVPMDLRVEIHPALQEISVWDGQTLVADYSVEILSDKGKYNEETKLRSRDGYINGAKIQGRSPLYPSADRVLALENNQYIVADQRVEGACYRMNQRDLNELALLLAVGARVSIVRNAEAFSAQVQ